MRLSNNCLGRFNCDCMGGNSTMLRVAMLGS